MFSYDSPFFKIFRHVENCIVISILTFLGCIPIITIGASISASFSLVFKLKESSDKTYRFKEYIDSFKRCFKRSTISFLLCVVCFIVIYISTVYWGKIDKSIFKSVFYTISFAMYIPLLLLFIYVFPYIALSNEKKLSNIYKNCLFVAYRKPFASLKIVIFYIIFILINLSSIYMNIFSCIIFYGVFLYAFLEKTMYFVLKET